MKLNGLEVISTVFYEDHEYVPYYEKELDALMIPIIIDMGLYKQVFYLKIPGKEIRKCLEHKEVEE